MTYAEAVERFQARIAQSPAPNPENKPFLLLHGRRTERSVLMVHGLTDSPHSMRALARLFHGQGYNVLAVLLPGHGTRPQDLLRVTLKEWRDETDFGLAAAAALGQKVSLAGFSTGGALVLDALRRSCAGPSPRDFGDVFLFTPALKLVSRLIPWACLPGVAPIMTAVRPWAMDTRGDANHYEKMALNAVCQLHRLILDNNAARPELLSAVAARGLGFFALATAVDAAVDSGATADFMASLPPQSRRAFILYPESENIAHERVTRPETNPRYAELEAALLAFLGGPNKPYKGMM
ncbi:MAG: alpha/beta fold hydrolase [Elusimicrobia bacterium]|nr:alpha/beta fold hydrolase [Elusimicrobiota bacterium]MDE2313252.1 alpha/beta fold hydrolase [Elusimicrobiota bacterium]